MFNANQLPETGFIRLNMIVGDPTAEPPIPAIFPVSKSTWWAGVKTGRFPKSVKIGPRTTAWKAEDIQLLLETLSHEGGYDEPLPQ